MIHRLFAGHFDLEAAASDRELKVIKPLEIDSVIDIARDLAINGDGKHFQIGKDAMVIEDGYADVPWLTMHTNRKAVEFMLRLNEETGCLFLDSHIEIITTEELRESLGCT